MRDFPMCEIQKPNFPRAITDFKKSAFFFFTPLILQIHKKHPSNIQNKVGLNATIQKTKSRIKCNAI